MLHEWSKCERCTLLHGRVKVYEGDLADPEASRAMPTRTPPCPGLVSGSDYSGTDRAAGDSSGSMPKSSYVGRPVRLSGYPAKSSRTAYASLGPSHPWSSWSRAVDPVGSCRGIRRIRILTSAPGSTCRAWRSVIHIQASFRLQPETPSGGSLPSRVNHRHSAGALEETSRLWMGRPTE